MIGSRLRRSPIKHGAKSIRSEGENMDIIVASLDKNMTFYIPVNVLFWLSVVTYILHIFEESVIPEVFVDKVKRLYWPNYTWEKFFGFNVFLLSLNIGAVITYESLHGAWIIFPLILLFERTFNGIYHVIETIMTRRHSSGLLTSVIVWILLYVLIRYSLLKGEITYRTFFISFISGLIMAGIMIVPMVAGRYKDIK
jgi:hypothetical protein